MRAEKTNFFLGGKPASERSEGAGEGMPLICRNARPPVYIKDYVTKNRDFHCAIMALLCAVLGFYTGGRKS